MGLKPTGSLIDVCILTAVARGEGGVGSSPRRDMNSSGLLREISGVVEITAQELDLSLERLNGQGFLESYEWPADGVMRRFFRLTDLGDCLLKRSLADWKDYMRRVDRFLRADPV